MDENTQLKKKYLITGITGFAGPHLANLLIKEGHEVYGLIRRSNGMETDIVDIVGDNFSKIKFVYSDLSNLRTLNKIFQEIQLDGVFNLAAQSHPPTSFVDPIGTMEANLIGTANLVQAVIDNQIDNCKFMMCSTSEVYGNSIKEGEKITEEHNLLPHNPYGVSKAACDLYLQERFCNTDLKGFITRSFSHTGARRGKTFSISWDAYNLALTKLGKQNNILKVGNLDSIRVVLDIRDIVNGYYLLMINEGSNGKVFNICGDVPRKMGEYTDMLINVSGLNNIIKEVCPKLYRPVDIHFQNGSCEKLKNLTGWQPQISIEQTMEDLFNYWVKKLS